jgi:hypothetical protein
VTGGTEARESKPEKSSLKAALILSNAAIAVKIEDRRLNRD